MDGPDIATGGAEYIPTGVGDGIYYRSPASVLVEVRQLVLPDTATGAGSNAQSQTGQGAGTGQAQSRGSGQNGAGAAPQNNWQSGQNRDGPPPGDGQAEGQTQISETGPDVPQPVIVGGQASPGQTGAQTPQQAPVQTPAAIPQQRIRPAPAYGEYVTIDATMLQLPQAGPVSILPLDASPFVKTVHDVQFADGVVTSWSSDRPSMLLAIAKVPLQALDFATSQISKILTARVTIINDTQTLREAQCDVPRDPEEPTVVADLFTRLVAAGFHVCGAGNGR